MHLCIFLWTKDKFSPCSIAVKTLICLTLIESSCCLKASSASLLGENILLCRVLFGGKVVGTANTPPSESLPTVDPNSERGRLRPPEERRYKQDIGIFWEEGIYLRMAYETTEQHTEVHCFNLFTHRQKNGLF